MENPLYLEAKYQVFSILNSSVDSNFNCLENTSLGVPTIEHHGLCKFYTMNTVGYIILA